MCSEPEGLTPDEIFEDWNSIGRNEKKEFIEKSAPEKRNAVAELFKEFGKSSNKMMSLYEKEAYSISCLLEKENKTPEEVERLLDRMDAIINMAQKEAIRKDQHNRKMLTKIGGIVAIIGGSVIIARGNKTTGAAIVAGGIAALFEDEMPKALHDALANLRNDSTAET